MTTATRHPPATVGIAAAAHNFDRDLDACWASIEALVGQARQHRSQLLVLPEAALGGYLANLSGDADDLPPAFAPDGVEVARLAALAGDLVMCVGYCEADGSLRYNAAVCVHDGRVLGHHRKVHQPLGENKSYEAGDRFTAFDTPVGRLGMQICYDKAFPEGARSAALDGARIIASLSAWPGSRTAPSDDLAEDRWTKRFDLFDQARALENQVVWAASNQAGTFGALRFVGRAKVVGPGGDILAATGTTAGLAVAHVDLEAALGQARRSMFHLRDRRPDSYRLSDDPAAFGHVDETSLQGEAVATGVAP
jgi:N-carbamoylputrescine amidase